MLLEGSWEHKQGDIFKDLVLCTPRLETQLGSRPESGVCSAETCGVAADTNSEQW